MNLNYNKKITNLKFLILNNKCHYKNIKKPKIFITKNNGAETHKIVWENNYLQRIKNKVNYNSLGL